MRDEASHPVILMLEDNAERIERFERIVASFVRPVRLRIWKNAWRMLQDMELELAGASLISLDHDLEPEESDQSDPGTGWDVTKYLASLPPLCPVIIHTSNGERATWMMGEFDLGGWEYHRLPPLWDDWIENDWRRLVRRLLRKERRS